MLFPYKQSEAYCRNYRRLSPYSEICDVDDICPHDDLWFGSNTNTNIAAMCSLFTDVLLSWYVIYIKMSKCLLAHPFRPLVALCRTFAIFT